MRLTMIKFIWRSDLCEISSNCRTKTKSKSNPFSKLLARKCMINPVEPEIMKTSRINLTILTALEVSEREYYTFWPHTFVKVGFRVMKESQGDATSVNVCTRKTSVSLASLQKKLYRNVYGIGREAWEKIENRVNGRSWKKSSPVNIEGDFGTAIMEYKLLLTSFIFLSFFYSLSPSVTCYLLHVVIHIVMRRKSIIKLN